jgi:hypothetical protein
MVYEPIISVPDIAVMNQDILIVSEVVSGTERVTGPAHVNRTGRVTVVEHQNVALISLQPPLDAFLARVMNQVVVLSIEHPEALSASAALLFVLL